MKKPARRPLDKLKMIFPASSSPASTATASISWHFGLVSPVQLVWSTQHMKRGRYPVPSTPRPLAGWRFAVKSRGQIRRYGGKDGWMQIADSVWGSWWWKLKPLLFSFWMIFVRALGNDNGTVVPCEVTGQINRNRFYFIILIALLR